ncbi:MAG: universal stress protein [Hydrogenophaga sp.]|jgi:hemerythrin-like domain-containing protein/nucleotide-binding universal stress UspA family protein|nr:universal stress protein [Hydrogenophaga sp.]
MYKHLLVALDDTPLGVTTVNRSVEFARALGARITFFYAAPDLTATGEGAMLFSLDRQAFSDESDLPRHAVLLKASNAARIGGVVCSTDASVSDHPAQAILDAAHRHACDLLFVSSHGRLPGLRGWLHGSVTHRLLQIADLPVHVASIESNDDEADANRALAIVLGEHRSIAAVLSGLQQLDQAGRINGKAPDLGLMHLMVDYLRQCPAKLHHPKEETFIFRLLRQHTGEHNAVLDELERQHTLENALIDSLSDALSRQERGQPDAQTAISAAVQRLSGAIWEHMSLEETVIFPAARRHLTHAEWSTVYQAFSAHQDPLLTHSYEMPMNQLFARIATVLQQGTSKPSTG